jgi:hypothetical protein
MKQAIAGIAGLKPRAPKPEGDGRLSKQESRALDKEYRVQRNETLRLKNFREQMLLAKARGELILRDLVERQAAYLLITMRQRMLAVPQAYAGRLVGQGDPHEAAQILRAAMIECLDELKDLPAKVSDASWLERVTEEEAAPPAAEEKPAEAKKRRGRRFVG